MTAPASPREIEELLPLYALDAVEPDEAAAIEAHLERDPAAQRRADEWRELAGLLGTSRSAAPMAVWDRIAASLGPAEGRALTATTASTAAPSAGATVRPITAAHGRRGRAIRWAVAATVAAGLVVAGAAAGRAVGGERDRALEVADAVRRDPDVRLAALRGPGGTGASIAWRPNGDGVLLGEALPTLPAGRTYQLWALVGDPSDPAVISAGVLGRDPDEAPFRFAGPVVGFVVTEEVDPGVVSSDNPAVLAGSFAA